MSNVKPTTIARTIIFFLSLLNQIFALAGKESIPFVEDDIYQLVSLIFTIGSGIWAWWKNNSFTSSAIKADETLKELKESNN